MEFIPQLFEEKTGVSTLRIPDVFHQVADV